MYKSVNGFEYTSFVTELMKNNKNIKVETCKDSGEINLVQIIDNNEVIAYRCNNKNKFDNYIWVGDKNDKSR